MRENVTGVSKNITGSDAGTEASWESIGPQRWAKKLQHEAMMEHDRKKEQDTDLQTPPSRRSRPSGSPEEYEEVAKGEEGKARVIALSLIHI